MGRPRTIPNYNFSGIYQILNLINGKKYIGQAQNILKRIQEHRRRRNGVQCYPETFLYKAVKKYGWESFDFSILEKIDNIELLNERECFWIKTLKTNERNIGYNIQIGGNCKRGWHHSEQTKEKLSLAKKNYFGVNNPFYGKKHTEETKNKIREKRLGKKWTEEQRKKYKRPLGAGKQPRAVLQINILTGQVIRKWESISEAARTLNIYQSEIVMVANQTPRRQYSGNKKNEKIYTKKSAGGFRWQYD